MSENEAVEAAPEESAETSEESGKDETQTKPLQMSFADWKKCKEALKPDSKAEPPQRNSNNYGPNNNYNNHNNNSNNNNNNGRKQWGPNNNGNYQGGGGRQHRTDIPWAAGREDWSLDSVWSSILTSKNQLR